MYPPAHIAALLANRPISSGWNAPKNRRCDAEIINTAPMPLLKAKGEAARERARTVFDRWNWFRAISGSEV